MLSFIILALHNLLLITLPLQMVAREEHDSAIARIEGFMQERKIYDARQSTLDDAYCDQAEHDAQGVPYNAPPAVNTSFLHHNLGSPSTACTLEGYLNSEGKNTDPLFRNFPRRLQAFLAKSFPSTSVSLDDTASD